MDSRKASVLNKTKEDSEIGEEVQEEEMPSTRADDDNYD